MTYNDYKLKIKENEGKWEELVELGRVRKFDDKAKREGFQRFFRYCSLYVFLKNLLGFKDLNSIHKELCWFMEEKDLFKLVLMPRYSFKSSLCTIGYALWELVRNPNQRILIYSDATAKAEAFLTSVKAQIDGSVENSIFAKIYNFYNTDKTATWNLSQIVIKERTTTYPEPSVDTGGIETTKVGMHYDTIIFDDIVSDKNVTTKAQMDKVAECYKKALSLLKPGGKVQIIGTRWNFGDLYGRLIAENNIRNTFKIFIKPAITEDGTYLFDNIGENSLTEEFLNQQKINQGTYTFSCLYQNNPVDPETAVFRLADFSFYGAIKKDDLYITATCDPAGEGEDFTAITVVGTDCNMDMHILDIVNEHLQPSEIIEKILNLHHRYTFKMFGLERNFYRGMLKKALDDKINEVRRLNPHFKLFGMREFEPSGRKGENKRNRIMALQPYHERGAIKFPGEKLELLQDGFSILSYQMRQFPHSAHDDILDSLAYHLSLVNRGGLVKKAELPHNSPAELERRAYDKEAQQMNRLPRRFRRKLNSQLAFS